jgi:hypothetical protein
VLEANGRKCLSQATVIDAYRLVQLHLNCIEQTPIENRGLLAFDDLALERHASDIKAECEEGARADRA